MENKKVYVLRGFYGERLEQRATLITAEDGSAIHDKALAIDRAWHMRDGLIEGLVHEIDSERVESYELDDLTETSVVGTIQRECFFSDRENRWVYVGREFEMHDKGYAIVSDDGLVLGIGKSWDEAWDDAWNNWDDHPEECDSREERDDAINAKFAITRMVVSPDAMKAIKAGAVDLTHDSGLEVRMLDSDLSGIFTREEYVRGLIADEGFTRSWTYR